MSTSAATRQLQTQSSSVDSRQLESSVHNMPHTHAHLCDCVFMAEGSTPVQSGMYTHAHIYDGCTISGCTISHSHILECALEAAIHVYTPIHTHDYCVRMMEGGVQTHAHVHDCASVLEGSVYVPHTLTGLPPTKAHAGAPLWTVRNGLSSQCLHYCDAALSIDIVAPHVCAAVHVADGRASDGRGAPALTRTAGVHVPAKGGVRAPVCALVGCASDSDVRAQSSSAVWSPSLTMLEGDMHTHAHVPDRCSIGMCVCRGYCISSAEYHCTADGRIYDRYTIGLCAHTHTGVRSSLTVLPTARDEVATDNNGTAYYYTVDGRIYDRYIIGLCTHTHTQYRHRCTTCVCGCTCCGWARFGWEGRACPNTHCGCACSGQGRCACPCVCAGGVRTTCGSTGAGGQLL